jgi:hypothetical protein
LPSDSARGAVPLSASAASPACPRAGGKRRSKR